MEFTHRTPGNLRAFVQLRLRNLVTGNTFDTRVSATDFLDEARLDTKELQVLYRDQSGVHRSEEHTSELQSRSDLVCRLLLEKKKKQNKYQQTIIAKYMCNMPRTAIAVHH